MNLEQHEEAIIYFGLALQSIGKQTVTNVDYSSTSTFSLVSTFHNAEKCFLNSDQFENAWQYFYKNLEFEIECNVEEVHDLLLIGLVEKFRSYARKLQEFGNQLCDLATCYMKQNNFKKAVLYFQRAFNLLKKLSKAEDVATIRVELLTCHMEVYQRDRLEKHIKELRMSGKNLVISMIAPQSVEIDNTDKFFVILKSDTFC